MIVWIPRIIPYVNRIALARARKITVFARFNSNHSSSKANELHSPHPPKASIRWFCASDVPISKPEWFNYTKTKDPESFLPFSEYDSNRLERAFKNKSSKPIEVNEDKLFEVNIDKFELNPVYWEGPIYEVRRGLWFNTDGTPLSNEVCKKLEQGYGRVKPYLFEGAMSEKKQKGNKDKISKFNKMQAEEEKDEQKIDLTGQKDVCDLDNGQLVLYFNENKAVMFPDNYDSDFQIDAIRYFGPNPVSLLGVNHIQRGYTEELQESVFDKLPDNPLPSIADTFQNEFGNVLGKLNFESDESKKGEVSDTAIDNDIDDKHMQQYLEADYDLDTSESKSNREIDHLIFCIHGIGQVLGNKYESVNFTHNINVLRNTMKKVYEENEDYQNLAYPDGHADKHNNRVQVLPISWRHRVDFSPQRTIQENKDSRLPTLSQLNVEGIKALRNMVGDVVLDVLLYYEPKYLKQIFTSVTSELNRVYKLYKERNPNFNGKVHILGHSLGSSIAFDILSGQSGTIKGSIDVNKDIGFDVENLFLAGSPVGLFKLLEGKNIEARTTKGYEPSKDSTAVAPKCKNLYNVFHPCDPVAYRIEPMVSPKFGDFKPVPIKFAVKGFNSQITELASYGDEISEKIASAVKWLNLTKKDKNTDAKSIEEKARQENALGDIISSIAFTDKEAEDDSEDTSTKRKLTPKELSILTSLNETGRIDYSLPMGVLDLSLISAVSAHISYFEDENTAGFIMKEVLSKHQPPKSETVTVY
ncbi:hypothetical protein CANMA_004860 [Candida margitis]|uniref:uncharacterized protein n=1 Tax=Candida margitis TaxID=1775924 RepID=UPI0022261230|nr:uncharacterized protein CANMA_004860 [Candida margitis]KAI5954021.1 hypothetical protein CANMA_004860 [Candida margitis]